MGAGHEKMVSGGAADLGDLKPQSVAFAKTTRPAIGSAMPRERLFARLDGTPGRTVAWISGPPGAGKTTLAASYIDARRYRCLWYQVDADDADVATFFHYLGHAARKLDAAAPLELPGAAALQDVDLASLARSFFRRLFARAKAPFALVLDNLHEVPAESTLHVALEAGLSQVPKNCCVIVTSRNEPPPALARARVTGEMVCVGWEQMRLEPAELAEIARLRGHELGGEAVAKLAERTQGWAAGLVLMLEHAKLSGRFAELPGDAAPKVIFDYLAGEIFERFEARTREFLLRIACLPRMNAEVAQVLTGEDKAGRLLLNLALNGYFVNEVQSEAGRMFQLHPLLRDFLRGRAAQELPEALADPWLQRAAALLRGAGQVEDAVALLAESNSWAEVARIAAEEAGAMLAQGRSATLEAWLDMLPPEFLERDPRLLHAAGVCRAHASPRAAQRAFEQAYEGFQGARDTRGMVQSACGAIDALMFEFDDLAPLEHWSAVLAGLLKDADAPSAAALVRATLLRDPGNAQLGAWLERAEQAAGGPSLARATAALLHGDPAAARAALESLRAREHNPPPRAGIAMAMVSALHELLAGSHAAALAAARAGLAVADAEGLHAWDQWLRAIAAAAALGAGERDAARAELQRLEAGGARLRRGDRALIHYLRGWLALLDADGAGARREAKTALALAIETGVPLLECMARIALAQSLGDEGDRRARESQLRAAEGLAERSRSDLLRYCARLGAASAAREAGDEAAALEALRGAFALGREHGYQHAPWWQAAAVAELCALALRHGIEPDYTRSLVRSRRLAPRVSPLRLRDWPWPFRVRALGRFELLRDASPVEFSGKGPGRPMELLKVLLAHGGQDVRADQIADALWPHVDADYAHKSFTATLHRLRRLLGEDDAVLLRDSRLSLNTALVWVDSWALEQVCAAIDEALRAPAGAAPDAELRALADEALALYRGPFLPDESEQPSYIACREQIRSRLLRCLARIARRWEDAGQPEAAADCYLRCIEADPLFEAPYRNLMLSYQRSGDQVEARATYERLRTILQARLKAAPSPETQAAYASLKASGP
jgi:ATP/maltotriose-dependent transcriptional regulator MalT/DNA-binding SARP family transcriptional activator